MLGTVIFGPKSNTQKKAKFVYNKDEKMSVARLEGMRTNCVIFDPFSENQFLLIQVKIGQEDQFTITLGVKEGGLKKNLIFSTSVRETRTNFFNLEIRRDEWVNLKIDLHGISPDFELLERIEITPSCFLRFIYTINEDFTEIPKMFALPSFVIQSIFSIPFKEPPRPSRIPIRSKTAPIDKKRKNEGGASANDNQKIQKPVKPVQNKFTAQTKSTAHIKTILPSTQVKAPTQVKTARPNPSSSDEELELVFLEDLSLYYCISNQQYYDLNLKNELNS